MQNGTDMLFLNAKIGVDDTKKICSFTLSGVSQILFRNMGGNAE